MRGPQNDQRDTAHLTTKRGGPAREWNKQLTGGSRLLPSERSRFCSPTRPTTPSFGPSDDPVAAESSVKRNFASPHQLRRDATTVDVAERCLPQHPLDAPQLRLWYAIGIRDPRLLTSPPPRHVTRIPVTDSAVRGVNHNGRGPACELAMAGWALHTVQGHAWASLTTNSARGRDALYDAPRLYVARSAPREHVILVPTLWRDHYDLG